MILSWSWMIVRVVYWVFQSRVFKNTVQNKTHRKELLRRETSTRPRNKSGPFSDVWHAISHFTLWRICLQVRSTRFRCVTFIVCVNCIKIPPGELFDDWLVNTLSTKQKGTSLFTCNSCGRKIRILWRSDWNSRPGFVILFITTKITGGKFSQRGILQQWACVCKVWSQVPEIYTTASSAHDREPRSVLQARSFIQNSAYFTFLRGRTDYALFCRIGVIIHSAI